MLFTINNFVGFDQRVIDEIKNHACLLSIDYETLAVHENIETLVVDIPNFLSQIGGNLGLFLGVSCLSFVTGIIQVSKHLMTCWKTKRAWLFVLVTNYSLRLLKLSLTVWPDIWWLST